jgi:hypothetical protein
MPVDAQGRRREHSRHRSTSRYAVPQPVGRAAAILTPVVSLLPAIVLAVVVQALSPVAQRLPEGSARFDLAGAWLASESGALAGTTSWLTAPTLGRVQLGLLIRALQGGQGQSVLAAAHGAMLLLTVVQIGLLWWALRRRGSGGVAAGLAVSVFAIAPIAIDTHAAVSATAVAVGWALLAAALALGSPARIALVAAGSAGVVAVACSPVLGIAMVPLAVLVAVRLRRRAVALAAGAGGAVLVLLVVMAVLAALPRTPATAALDRLVAAQGIEPSVGAAALGHWLQVDPLLLVVALGAGVLAAVGARDVRGTGLVALLAIASVWPLGTDATGPLLMLLPAVAATVARSVDVGVAALGHPLFVRSVLGSGWLMAVGAVLVVAVVGWLGGLGGLVRGPDQPIAQAERWVRSSVPAGQTVLVGLGAWPDLAASSRATVGWYASRPGATAVPGSIPWSRADYVVADDSLPADRTGPADAVLDRSLEVAVFGSGAAALSVRAVEPAQQSGTPQPPETAEDRAAAQERQDAGRQLAENPRIEVSGRDRALLLAGDVDTRIALVLAQFVTQHRVTVTGLGVADGDTSGIRTTVTISRIDGSPVPSDGTKTGVLLRFLSDLSGDLATRSIDATNDGITASFEPRPSG